MNGLRSTRVEPAKSWWTVRVDALHTRWSLRPDSSDFLMRQDSFAMHPRLSAVDLGQSIRAVVSRDDYPCANQRCQWQFDCSEHRRSSQSCPEPGIDDSLGDRDVHDRYDEAAVSVVAHRRGRTCSLGGCPRSPLGAVGWCRHISSMCCGLLSWTTPGPLGRLGRDPRITQAGQTSSSTSPNSCRAGRLVASMRA